MFYNAAAQLISGDQTLSNHTSIKVGVYVDGENVRMNGGFRMRYDVLREFATRDGAEPLRLNTYLAYDPKRASSDYDYLKREQNFHNRVRDYGFKVIQKIVRWYQDSNGDRRSKANADLDLAVDVLLQSENLDRVVLATGDGDFVQVVRALQSKGCRVEVLAFDNVSMNLRREADMFMSGYLVPDLVPPQEYSSGQRNETASWGEMGSRVRGHCYYHHESKPFGFMRFMQEVSSGIWITDSRDESSPYETVFFYDSELPSGYDTSGLPTRDQIFEFELAPPRNEGEDRLALNIRCI